MCSAAHSSASRATRRRKGASTSSRPEASDPEPDPSSSRQDESASMVTAPAKDASLPGPSKPGPKSSKARIALREMELHRERIIRRERKEKALEEKRGMSPSVMSTDGDFSNAELGPIEAGPVMAEVRVPVPAGPGRSHQVVEVPVPAEPGPSSQGSGSGKTGGRRGGGVPYSTGVKIGLRETELRLAEAKLDLPHDEVVEEEDVPRRDTSRSRSERSEKRAKASLEEVAVDPLEGVPKDVEQRSLSDLRLVISVGRTPS